MKKIKNIIKDRFLISLVVIMFFIFFYNLFYSFRMEPNYNYDSDFGRDLLRMYEILNGKPTLIGPQLSVAGLHMAPYSYYIFAPFLFMGGYDHRFVLVANALFFIGGFVFLYIFLQKNWGKLYTFLSLIWIITTPYIILSARSEGNAFSYLFLLLILYFLVLLIKKISTIKHFIFALFEGIVINFHPINSILIVWIHITKIIKTKEKTITKFKNLFVVVIGIVITFIPIFLFDLRHNFIISKYLFDAIKYNKFFGNNKLQFSFDLLFNLNLYTSSLIFITLIGILILVIFAFSRNFKKNKYLSVYLWIAVLNVLFLFFLREGAVHYFFPIILFLQVLYLLINFSDKYRYVFLSLLILVNLIFFPTHLYKPARNLKSIENNFFALLKEKSLPKNSLNVILLNQTHLSKVGYEYRFLLKKNKYDIDDEYSYVKSKRLLLVSEMGDIDWEKETSWEFEQFGDKTLINTYKITPFTYYLFKKAQ